jgi:hypothetical protein
MSNMNSKRNTLADLLKGGAFDGAAPAQPRTLAGLINGAFNSTPPAQPQPASISGLLARELSRLVPKPGSEAFIQAAWEKARIAAGYDVRYIRMDRFGALIARSRYGMQIELGWHIDHFIPSSKGGSDELHNREPLHWRNNLAKSDRSI